RSPARQGRPATRYATTHRLSSTWHSLLTGTHGAGRLGLRRSAGHDPRRCGRDADEPGTGDDALDGFLRLDVENVDEVALGATVERLAAHGEHHAGHLVDESHGLVTLHDLRLHQVGPAEQLAGAQRSPCGEPDHVRGD